MNRHAGGRASAEGPRFAGDLNREVPKQFWRDLERCLIEMNIVDEKAKCKYFKLSLIADSAADTWYSNLPKTTRESWDQLEAAFETKWTGTTPPTMTDADALDFLINRHLIKIDDVLAYDDTPGYTGPARRKYRKKG